MFNRCTLPEQKKIIKGKEGKRHIPKGYAFFVWTIKQSLVGAFLVLLFVTPCFADILSIAQAEIGHGEATGNNCGPDIRRYLKGQEDLSWCAGFVSWVLEQAEFKELDYSLSAKAIFNQAKAKNMLTANPQPGDLVVFWRESPHSWKGHIGIVSDLTSTQIVAIEGNRGEFPAIVKEVTYPKSHIPKLLGFISTKGATQ